VDRNGALSFEERLERVSPLWAQSTNLLKHMGRLIGLKRCAAPGAELNRDIRRATIMNDQPIRAIRFVEGNQTVRALKWIRMLGANMVGPVGHGLAAML
jgi:hypothetical protein